jgi:hypothetical protein
LYFVPIQILVFVDHAYRDKKVVGRDNVRFQVRHFTNASIRVFARLSNVCFQI